MSIPLGIIRGDPGDEYAQGTDQLHALGTIMVFANGRKFRYCKAGELLLVAESLQGPDEEVEVDLTVAAGTIGDQFISLTAKGTEAKDFYKEGFIYLSIPGSSSCRLYQIKSHALLAIATGNIINIVDDAGTQEAIVGDEEAAIQASPWAGVKSHTGGQDAPFVGIAVEDIASGSFGWVQTGGPGIARLSTTVAEGDAITSTSGTASELDVKAASSEPVVGYVVRGPTGTDSIEVGLVMLTVD
jgi:hypothetical protein